MKFRKKSRYTRDLLVGENFSIGEHTYGHPKVYGVWQGARLTIGKFCSIAGDDVEIFLGDNHRTEWISTYPFPAFPDKWPEAAGISDYHTSRGDVVIGNDVWIGHRAMILSGVRIGDGAVIGAGAVVARNVEPYGVAVGNPARVVRKRFDGETIRKLLALSWWDWPIDRIRAHIEALCSVNLEALPDMAGQGGEADGTGA
jgi:acetyltransferase-like isoleucine patch superfamily enzyme